MKKNNFYKRMIISMCLIGVISTAMRLHAATADSEPVMTLTTTKAIGEKIRLKIDAATTDKPDVWIDLNGNGMKDSGESVTTFDSYKEYLLGATTIKIYGRITTLYCSSNQLIVLDVSKNEALTYLSCLDNQLTALDVSQNKALEALYCDHNQLTALDVSQNSALKTLYCYSNQLTALDVSKNTALTKLYCQNNSKLTFLNVANGNNINFDGVYTNHYSVNASACPKLTCIQVDKDFDPTVQTGTKVWKKDAGATWHNDGTPCGGSAISETEAALRISLYPNPAKERATVMLPAGLSVQYLYVLNLSGQVVHTQSIERGQATIDVSHYAKGVYLLRIGNAVRKLVVE